MLRNYKVGIYSLKCALLILEGFCPSARHNYKAVNLRSQTASLSGECFLTLQILWKELCLMPDAQGHVGKSISEEGISILSAVQN